MVFEPPCTERYARWCERSTAQIMSSLLLDLEKCNLRYRFSPIEKIMRNFMQKEGDLYNLANYKSITNA